MNSAQLHIALVHGPVVACALTVVLFGLALCWQDERLQKLCYAVFLGCAVLTAVAYYTGPWAYELYETFDWFNAEMKARTEDHAIMGRNSFVGMVLLGLGSLVALLGYAQGQAPAKPLRWGIFTIALVLSLLLIWTSHEGGLIRRLEIS
ncbi:MAG: hypothetical protein H8E15_10190 [Planctomycetes bacterium]|nr:hypothetical protein [Planctomycetota bacterium]